jgi:hypothetical protein
VVYRKSLGVPPSDPLTTGNAPRRTLAEHAKPD